MYFKQDEVRSHKESRKVGVYRDLIDAYFKEIETHQNDTESFFNGDINNNIKNNLIEINFDIYYIWLIYDILFSNVLILIYIFS